MISAYARSENGYALKMAFFWSELGSGFGEPGSTPQQEFPGVAPLPSGYQCINFL